MSLCRTFGLGGLQFGRHWVLWSVQRDVSSNLMCWAEIATVEGWVTRQCNRGVWALSPDYVCNHCNKVFAEPLKINCVLLAGGGGGDEIKLFKYLTFFKIVKYLWTFIKTFTMVISSENNLKAAYAWRLYKNRATCCYHCIYQCRDKGNALFEPLIVACRISTFRGIQCEYRWSRATVEITEMSKWLYRLPVANANPIHLKDAWLLSVTCCIVNVHGIQNI